MKLSSSLNLKVKTDKKPEKEHFKAQIIDIQDKPVTKRFDNKCLFNKGINLLDAKTIYQLFFHGKSFQVLDCLVDIKEEYGVCLINHKIESFFQSAQFETHIKPVVLEAVLQSCCLHYTVKSQDDYYILPSKIKFVQFTDDYYSSTATYVVSKFLYSDESYVYFDARVLDKNKNILANLNKLAFIKTQIAFLYLPQVKLELGNIKKSLDIASRFSNKEIMVKPLNSIKAAIGSNGNIKQMLTEEEIQDSFKINNERRRTEHIAGVIIAKELFLQNNKGFELSDLQIKKEGTGKTIFL